MNSKEETEYIRCFNCGKYIIAEDAYKGRYCTLACSSQFSKCRGCGSFFPTKEGLSDDFCSDTCSTEKMSEN